MISLLLFFIPRIYSVTQDDPEIDTLFLEPQIISDFVNSKQLRNLTITGDNELTPINGRYFTKIMFDLWPTLSPTFLSFQSVAFVNFDGLLFNGESKGMAKFADLFLYDCSFTDGSTSIMNIRGPKHDHSDSQD